MRLGCRPSVFLFPKAMRLSLMKGQDGLARCDMLSREGVTGFLSLAFVEEVCFSISRVYESVCFRRKYPPGGGALGRRAGTRLVFGDHSGTLVLCDQR